VKTGFIVEGITYANFFSRIVSSLESHDQENTQFFVRDNATMVLIQNKLPEIRTTILPCYSVPESYLFEQEKPILYSKMIKGIEDSFEFVIGGVPFSLCWEIYLSTFIFMHDFLQKNNIDKVIMCSGCGIYSKAVALACQLHKIQTRFIELSNLPEKIFIDSEGTNANAMIARVPEFLDVFPTVDEQQHQIWMESWFSFKSRPLPQSLKNPLQPLIEKCSTQRVLNRKKTYIFVPLQVSNDAQLWLYGKHRNIDTIKYALKIGMESGEHVVVKIHPAETSVQQIKEIIDLKRKFNFVLTMENSGGLVKNASQIITVNSTVGLEAMLFKKKVTFLGSSIYKSFDYEMLKKYIHHYLFSGIDFFSEGHIERDVAYAFMLR
jgi:capsular polysaccharide export protein